MTQDTDQAADKGTLERLLSPIADVRRGEAPSVLLMALTMFLILAGYYLLKTAREIFILSEGGAEVKSYSSAGQALMLLVLCRRTARLRHASIAPNWCSGSRSSSPRISWCSCSRWAPACAS